MTKQADSGALKPFEPPRRVIIPAPSYQVLTRGGEIDHERREKAIASIESLGMIPTLMGGVFEQTARFAGTDEVRARDFETALLSTDADLVMPLRGGYGMTRVLHLLDWEKIASARMPAVGFSDFTAFNLALLAKTGRFSWQGPMLMSFANPDPFMVERFRVVFGENPGPLVWEADPDLLDCGSAKFRAAGTLWGGNLCLIESLLGTPWFPERETEGGILFLEDVGEAAYRVERMLLTLLEAGILHKQKAILLGAFTNADDAVRFEGDQTLARTLSYIRSRLPQSIPMATGLPFGHIERKATLPVGLPAEFALEGSSAALTWSMPS